MVNAPQTTTDALLRSGQRHALEHMVASEVFLRLIPREFARAHLICGVCQPHADSELELIVSRRTSEAAIWNTRVRIDQKMKTQVCDDEAIARFVDEAYDKWEREQLDQRDRPSAPSVQIELAGSVGLNATGAAFEDAIHQSIRAALAADRDLLSLDGKGPVIRLVDAMLFEALSKSASDIHVQPLADRTLVRYRIDGVLIAARELPHSLTNALVSRIKVMAQMDVAERHAPQDGRATVTIGREVGTNESPASQARSIDLRISTLPTSYGERAVVRLLDNARGTHLADFETLGMPPKVRAILLDRACRSHGIILVTGPTGSGKTTTLYTLLRHVARTGISGKGGDLNVMTIEDPIEYELSTSGTAISQSQINPRKGVTFATGLRHILRQDPDVVMVGEIRDAETARIALQASLTGHLVLSTLHTNDAASAITRLVDLGTEPFLVAASLSAVMAQRLVRRTHAACAGNGCERCLDSGYSGRIGVFELLVVNEALRSLMSKHVALAAIRSHAAVHGMTTLLEEGQRLVRDGLTNQAEILRVLQGMDELVEPSEEHASEAAVATENLLG